MATGVLFCRSANLSSRTVPPSCCAMRRFLAATSRWSVVGMVMAMVDRWLLVTRLQSVDSPVLMLMVCSCFDDWNLCCCVVLMC